MQRIRPYFIFAAIVLLIFFLLQKINWLPSFQNLFKSQPLKIDETRVLIQEIHNLSQVITISMFDEVVMDSSKPKNLPSFPGLRPVPDRIVLIGKGQVLAGVDLAKIKDTSVYVNGDSVSVLLPNAEIFSTILNPSDFETFDEVGEWTAAEVTDIKTKMKNKITVRALQNQILRKASERCRLLLENLLQTFGFTKISFHPNESP